MYGVLWTAETITWYIDGVATSSIATPSDMHSPMYMLVNLAIGGDWPGDPSASFTGADLLVDYVRAYSLDEMNRPLSISAAVTTSLADGYVQLTLTGTGDVNGTGNALANTLNGNAGANQLDGGVGADTMVGGAGDDRDYVDHVGDVVTELASQGWDRVFSSVSYSLGNNVEALTLTGAADVNGTGNALGNSLMGNSGANTLNGGDGADTLNGFGGNDTLVGGTGADRFVFSRGTGADTINDFGLNGEKDVIDLSAFSAAGIAWRLTQQGADILISMGTGETVLVRNTTVGNLQADSSGYVFGAVITDVISDVSATLGVSELRLTLTGTANIDGSGNGLDNVLIGNAGANVLDGAGGVDSMSGGAGDDRYYVDNAADVVTELANNGWDRVMSTVSYALGANVEAMTLTGTASINGTGNALGNSIFGNAGANVLNGGDGADTLNGYGGADTLIGGAGADRFVFTRWAGADTINDFGLNGEKDVIDISFFRTAGITSTLTQQGSDVLVSMATGETVLVRNVVVANFQTDTAGYVFTAVAPVVVAAAMATPDKVVADQGVSTLPAVADHGPGLLTIDFLSDAFIGPWHGIEPALQSGVAEDFGAMGGPAFVTALTPFPDEVSAFYAADLHYGDVNMGAAHPLSGILHDWMFA